MTKKLVHTPRSRKDGENRAATVAEVRKWIVAGSLAATQQMYTQLTQETERINAEYRMELEERVAKLEARIAALEPGHFRQGVDADGKRWAAGEYLTVEDRTRGHDLRGPVVGAGE